MTPWHRESDGLKCRNLKTNEDRLENRTEQGCSEQVESEFEIFGCMKLTRWNIYETHSTEHLWNSLDGTFMKLTRRNIYETHSTEHLWNSLDGTFMKLTRRNIYETHSMEHLWNSLDGTFEVVCGSLVSSAVPVECPTRVEHLVTPIISPDRPCEHNSSHQDSWLGTNSDQIIFIHRIVKVAVFHKHQDSFKRGMKCEASRKDEMWSIKRGWIVKHQERMKCEASRKDEMWSIKRGMKCEASRKDEMWSIKKGWNVNQAHLNSWNMTS